MAERTRASAWTALRIDVPATAVEAVANFLVEAGATGVVTEVRDLTVPTPEGVTSRLETAIPTGTHERVSAALARYLASLAEIDPSVGAARVESVPVEAVDWTAVARRHHRPVPVGRRLLVAPPWDARPLPGRETLVIEPAMAFGTGGHATTRSCLAAIEAALTDGAVTSAVDIGTGTGILAIALARLGVPRVVALDVDPAVLPMARANCRRNRTAEVHLVAGTAASLRGPFDLVVANLIADTLVADASVLQALVAPGGHLILSGVLADQEDTVRRAHRAWAPPDDCREDGWSTLHYRAPAERR